MRWVGTGVVWSLAGGVPASRLLSAADTRDDTGFSFVQISDTHVGFNKPANTDVLATLKRSPGLSAVQRASSADAETIATLEWDGKPKKG